MKSGKVLTMKAVALGVAVMFIAASCGSSDSASGGKTKNSALCFATQEEKDAAIETAQADLDAATATDTTGAAGGYRRPAVRSMSGDTTVPPDTIAPTSDTTLDTTVPSSDTTVVDSGPNIPMLEQALADAQNQPLCDAEGSSVENTYPPEPASYNTTTQHVVAGDGYDLEIPEGGQWFHAEGFGDAGTCYEDDGGGVWAALVLRDSTGALVIQDWISYSGGCIGANITIFLPAGSYSLFAGTGDAEGESYDCGYPLDFNLTFGLGGGDNPAPAELPESDSTTSTTSSVPTPDTLPIEILGGGDGDTTTSSTVADTIPATTIPATTVAGQTPDTTPAATTLPAVTTEAIAIPQGTTELTCDANCVTTLFESFGFTDGEITLSAGADEVVVQYGDQSASVKVGTRAKEIKVSAVSASGTKAEKSVGVELTKTPDAPWVAPGTAAAATSTSESSKSIYIYVLIALLILVAIGYMRRKKATETK